MDYGCCKTFRTALFLVLFIFSGFELFADDIMPSPIPESKNQHIQLLSYYYIYGYQCKIRYTGTEDHIREYVIKVNVPQNLVLSTTIPEFVTEEDSAVYLNGARQISGVSTINAGDANVYEIITTDGVRQRYYLKIHYSAEFSGAFEFDLHPSYSNSYEMVNIGADGSMFLGAALKWGLLGLDISGNYFVFNGEFEAVNLSGFWTILRAAPSLTYHFSDKLTMKWALGASWIYSPFEYGSSELYTRNNPGLFLQFDANYYLLPALRLDFISQFDLFWETAQGNPFLNTDLLYPYIKGGIRATIHPQTSWLQVFFGVSGLYSGYKGEIVDTNVSMLMFEMGFHLSFQAKHRKKEDSIQNADKSANTENLLPDIIFNEDSDDLTERSLKNLEKIVTFLKGYADVSILMTVHTNQGGEPASVISASVRKMIIVRNLLVERGIEKERLKIPSEVIIQEDGALNDMFIIRFVLLENE